MVWDRLLWIRLAAMSGFISVAAGAFAAHGIADPAAKELLRTGSQYEAIHAMATLAWAALVPSRGAGALGPPALFLAGSALFSGSLYALALGAPRWTGVVTPVGGLMFLAGWAMFAWQASLAGSGVGDHSES